MSGGGSESLALLVLATASATTGTSDVQGGLWRTVDGVSTDLAGGCGPSGQAFSACLIHGNANFAFRLRGANVGFPGTAALVLSRDRLDLPCGSCRLVPDPASGIVVVLGIDGVGNAAVPLALPASTFGISFFSQWVVTSFTSCAPLGASLSAAQLVVIE